MGFGANLYSDVRWCPNCKYSRSCVHLGSSRPKLPLKCNPDELLGVDSTCSGCPHCLQPHLADFSKGSRTILDRLPFTVVGKGLLDHAPMLRSWLLSIARAVQLTPPPTQENAVPLLSWLWCLSVLEGKMHDLALSWWIDDYTLSSRGSRHKGLCHMKHVSAPTAIAHAAPGRLHSTEEGRQKANSRKQCSATGITRSCSYPTTRLLRKTNRGRT